MSDKTMRTPIHVTSTSLMVTADVEGLVHANVGEMLELLLDKFLDDFTELANGEADREYAFERLQGRLTEYVSTRVALTGPQAMRVAGRMAELARPLVERSARAESVVRRTRQLREGAA